VGTVCDEDFLGVGQADLGRAFRGNRLEEAAQRNRNVGLNRTIVTFAEDLSQFWDLQSGRGGPLFA
jgi:hypothetical protein